MSNISVDLKYLDIVSSSIEKFKKKSDKLWNCKCPICHDGKAGNKKTRGFFFFGTKENNIVYACHNCLPEGMPFELLLKQLFPTYYTQYKLENMRTRPTKLVTRKIEDKRKPPQMIHTKVLVANTEYNVQELPDNHIAKQYLKSRLITQYDRFAYTDNFCQYVAEHTNNAEQYARLPKDKRIIIPLKSPTGEVWGFQGRAFDDKGIRYITIKTSEEYCKVFGLDRYNKNSAGFIVEGPFDSTFLPNCISMCGSSLDMRAVENGHIIPDKNIIIFDNEPRNPQIVKRMLAMVDEGFRVYVPQIALNTKLKDINKMAEDGWTAKDLVSLFVTNSYTGMKAKLKINTWKKV